MADLTLIQRFGTNATFNETSKILSINLTDLANIIVGGTEVGLGESRDTCEIVQDRPQTLAQQRFDS
jgi:hypothetical protein